MSNNGKLLESFDQQIEKTLLPNKFTITTNDKVFSEDGVPIAEFDIVITGKIGSTNFKWLIECRDRPSQGPVPGEWIEQLVGRRDRFNFDKIIAVSTTGFAEGAKTYAKDKDIEIRVINEGDLSQISDWFLVKALMLTKSNAILEKAELNIDENETEEKVTELSKILLSMENPNIKILRSTETGEYISLPEAFVAVADSSGLFNDLVPNGKSKKLYYMLIILKIIVIMLLKLRLVNFVLQK